MMVGQSLLELLSVQMKYEYLSDLRFLSRAQRLHLSQKIERLTAREEELQDWNDALVYLTGSPPEKTASEAKSRLIELLRQPLDKER